MARLCSAKAATAVRIRFGPPERIPDCFSNRGFLLQKNAKLASAFFLKGKAQSERSERGDSFLEKHTLLDHRAKRGNPS